jgi:uncharacterized tellurite resistance protein B-like protein
MLTFSQDPNVAEQQMNAIIFYLTAFGYIDGNFDFTEKTFVRIYIRQLVTARAKTAMPDADTKTREEVVGKFVSHFHEVFESIDRSVHDLFDEAVADGEDVEKFVYAKLKLRSYEIFQSFDHDNQRELLATIDELIYADGSAHPSEQKFRQELEHLLDSPIALQDIEILKDQSKVEIADPAAVTTRHDNHPFFATFEQHYSADPGRLRQQAAADLDLMKKFLAKLDSQRLAGTNKLMGKKTVHEFIGQKPFLDEHVYVVPPSPNRSYELIVLGDLHGCYSCLKAAIHQAELHREGRGASRPTPTTTPTSASSCSGTTSTAAASPTTACCARSCNLFLTAPEHVFVLRGNHEYYIEYRGPRSTAA